MSEWYRCRVELGEWEDVLAPRPMEAATEIVDQYWVEGHVDGSESVRVTVVDGPNTLEYVVSPYVEWRAQRLADDTEGGAG